MTLLARNGSRLLEVRNLVKHFPVKAGFLKRSEGVVKAVDDVSFEIHHGETFSLVGESGSGKSTIANLALKLLEPTSGDILFAGVSIVGNTPSAILREYRRGVQAVFQDPYGALNPRMTTRAFISEPLEVHGYTKLDRDRRVEETLNAVGLPQSSADQYPHEFSGGQRQRIGIARALALEPRLIVLDEPVSSLDVSIRAQVLNLLKDIQRERGISYLLISHDLAYVEHMSHRIGVMYLGKLVEVAEADQLYVDPFHPYTAALVAAATPPGRQPPWQMPIIGEVPRALEVPSGCAFHTRCPYVMTVCKTTVPTLSEVEHQRWVACHLYPDQIGAINKAEPTLTVPERVHDG